MKKEVAIRSEDITNRIVELRGKQVILDSDIAFFYQYEVKALNQAVKRNSARFPEGVFCFQLTKDEYGELANLKSQTVTSNETGQHGGRRKLPYAFTEQGVAMLAGILKSPVAVRASVQIIEAFVQMRRFIASNAILPTEKTRFLESKIIEHDEKIGQLFQYIEQNSGNKRNTAIIDTNIASVAIRPEIYQHVKKYLRNEDFFHAVEESYKVIRRKLKDLTGKEKAHEAISETNYQNIFGHSPADNVEKDFFDGVKYLHMAVQFFRNEKVHTPATKLDKNLAIHYIVMASLAYDLISKGKNE